MSTIFLDRDGVINENRADYVKSWQEFRFLPGAREAIAKLSHAGHRIIVCTNQAGIARGSLSRETVEEIHRRMVVEIMQVGGKIERVYYCPHTDALPIAKARGFSLVVVRTLTILRWSLVRDLRSFEPTRSGAEDVYALEASLPHSRVRGTLLAARARVQATPRA